MMKKNSVTTAQDKIPASKDDVPADAADGKDYSYDMAKLEAGIDVDGGIAGDGDLNHPAGACRLRWGMFLAAAAAAAVDG